LPSSTARTKELKKKEDNERKKKFVHLMNYCNVIANLRVLLRDARREIRVLSCHRLGHMVNNRALDPRRVRLFFECTVCRNRSRSVNG
jgi:hypothetical protein